MEEETKTPSEGFGIKAIPNEEEKTAPEAEPKEE